MFLIKTHFLLLLLITVSAYSVSADNNGFSFIFHDSKLDGTREISPDGQVIHTNKSVMDGVGNTFYSNPFRFKNSATGDALSFSTTFVFGMVPENPAYTFHGMAFAITPSKEVVDASSSQHLGLFNRTNDGNASNHIIAVEFDTFRSLELGDIDSNHVGLDINSIVSVNATSAGYFKNENHEFENITLSSSKRIRAWIDYDGARKQINITIGPLHEEKPSRPLMSINRDLSPFLLEEMYVGFTSATGVLTQTYYVVGWSFQLNGKAQELAISKLPSIPLKKRSSSKKKLVLATGLSFVGLLIFLSFSAFAFVLIWKRKHKFKEVLEDWEVEYGPHRFVYKDLYVATKGFKESELLGRGGFGQVYKGTLPELDAQVAVKKIWHESGQGMKEFVAEIATIGRLRHPNLVRLLGYCRRKGELFLVYDYMPNASLDNFLFSSRSEFTLSWKQRFKIIMDVAEAVTFLHEEWVEVIIHRDIKASNVLLDGEMNGKLGDFGLARFCNTGKDAQTTHLAGTLGYIAPELARKGKATTATDVFAFGAFCLEVACGRRPVQAQGPEEAAVLVEWVVESWLNGEILQTVDQRLNNDFNVEEMELVLKIGMLCSHSVPAIRPSMSQVLKFLKGIEPLPEDFGEIMGVREEYSGRLSHISSWSGYSSQLRSSASVTITEPFTSAGR